MDKQFTGKESMKMPRGIQKYEMKLITKFGEAVSVETPEDLKVDGYYVESKSGEMIALVVV